MTKEMKDLHGLITMAESVTFSQDTAPYKVYVVQFKHLVITNHPVVDIDEEVEADEEKDFHIFKAKHSHYIFIVFVNPGTKAMNIIHERSDWDNLNGYEDYLNS